MQNMQMIKNFIKKLIPVSYFKYSELKKQVYELERAVLKMQIEYERIDVKLSDTIKLLVEQTEQN